MDEGRLFPRGSPFISVSDTGRLTTSPLLDPFMGQFRKISILPFFDACSSNDYHSVMVVVVVMMMTPTMVAIRLRIRRSREEGKESKYQ
jgi:hypothetical protein